MQSAVKKSKATKINRIHYVTLNCEENTQFQVYSLKQNRTKNRDGCMQFLFIYFPYYAIIYRKWVSFFHLNILRWVMQGFFFLISIHAKINIPSIPLVQWACPGGLIFLKKSHGTTRLEMLVIISFWRVEFFPFFIIPTYSLQADISISYYYGEIIF